MKHFKKYLSIVLSAAVMFTAAGCSDFLESIASRKALSDFEPVVADFMSNPTDYVEVDSLNEDQLALAMDGFADVSYTIDEEVDLNSDRDEAQVVVTFENVRILDNIPVGTVDEVNSYIDDSDTDDVELTFTLVRDESSWEVDEYPDFYEVFFEPYSHISYIDENGMPTAFNQEFFDECVVDAVYYDPVMGNPLDRANISGPVAIEMVVYFDRLMYLPFTAELIKNGDVIQTVEVDCDGLSIANCDFSGQTYSAGTYTVNLYYDEGVVATADITVTN